MKTSIKAGLLILILSLIVIKLDLKTLAQEFLIGDTNNDGAVNFLDFNNVVANYGKTLTASQTLNITGNASGSAELTWNRITNTVTPFENNFDEIFSEYLQLDENFVIKDDAGLVYWPKFNVRQFNSFTTGKGYMVFADSDFSVTFEGYPHLDPLTISIPQGWSMFGNPLSHDLSLPCVFNSHFASGAIELIDDNQGRVYRPSAQVYDIETIESGAGYRIYTNEAVDVEFDSSVCSYETGIPTTQVNQLNPGWNLIGISIWPSKLTTAKDICSQSEHIDYVYRWNGSYVPYICNSNNSKNFVLYPAKAYFVSTNSPASISISGQSLPVSYYEQGEYEVIEGWNKLAVIGAETLILKASELCGPIYNGLEVTEINKWENGGWSAHVCGYEFNDFTLKKYSGYFVKVERTATINTSLTIPTAE